MEESIEKKKVFYIQLGVAIGSIVIGTLLHFLYQWTGENCVIAAFSAVNESVWEHLKMLFFPMLLFGIGECFFVKDTVNNYLEAKVIGILQLLVLQLLLFILIQGCLVRIFYF